MRLNLTSSLRTEIKKKIKQDHKDLVPGTLSAVSRYFTYLSKRDNWWLVLLHVVFLFFLLGLFQIDFLSIIKLEKKSADILIDQRTSNVATIISMTLAVIGLLLSNLAIKDNQTYKLLFVNSRLYLILYYTLSVIFCLMLISTLRDTLPSPFFQDFVIAGTYLALLILIGVGYLFRTIINFANPSKIQSILTSELMLEAKANLCLNLLSKYSRERFLKFMGSQNIDIISKNIAEHRQGLIPQPEVEERLIFDIDLAKLKKELLRRKDKTQRFYFTQALSINLVTKDYKDYVWPNMIELGGKEMKLSKCLKLKHTSKRLGHSDEYKAYFDKKLQEYSAEGKHSKAEEILSVYQDLFVLSMKHS